MNFDYIKDAMPKTEELVKLYDALCQDIEHAENNYWYAPQKSGMQLRMAAEKVCRIYNSYYDIGFAKNASLEDYLCYTGVESHNVMVSRFLSVVRQEQRDRLEWIRVWGDECIFMDENPDEIIKGQDRLYLNVKKMMSAMMDVTKSMCKTLDHLQDLDDWIFEEHVLPGYKSEEEKIEEEEQRRLEEKKNKKWFPFGRKK